MSYISTFDTVFFALWVFYAVSFTAAALAWRVWEKAFIVPGSHHLRIARWTNNGLWLIAIAIGMYGSIEGTTTFLTTCVLVACVVGAYGRYRAERRLQRELCGLSDHMVDTLPPALGK